MIEDHPIGRRFAVRRAHGFGRPLDTAFQVGKGAVTFGPAQRRQHHIGFLRRLGQEEILNNQEIELVEIRSPSRPFGCRIGTHDIQRFELFAGAV